jgi:hypothetical protein
MKLVISAVIFVALLVLFFLRERRFWKRTKETQARTEEEVPKLISLVNSRYERKYGHPADSLTKLSAAAGKNHRS